MSSRGPTPDFVFSPPRIPNQSPFKTPPRGSRASSFRASSIRASSSAVDLSNRPQQYFRSRRIAADQVEKPWLDKKDPRKKWHTIVPLIGILLGICFTGLLCYQGINSVINYKYCLIYDEDFSSGALNDKIWSKEVEVGGFGYDNRLPARYEKR